MEIFIEKKCFSSKCGGAKARVYLEQRAKQQPMGAPIFPTKLDFSLPHYPFYSPQKLGSPKDVTVPFKVHRCSNPGRGTHVPPRI